MKAQAWIQLLFLSTLLVTSEMCMVSVIQTNKLDRGAFTYDVIFLGRSVKLHLISLNRLSYLVKYLIRVGR